MKRNICKSPKYGIKNLILEKAISRKKAECSSEPLRVIQTKILRELALYLKKDRSAVHNLANISISDTRTISEKLFKQICQFFNCTEDQLRLYEINNTST